MLAEALRVEMKEREPIALSSPARQKAVNEGARALCQPPHLAIARGHAYVCKAREQIMRGGVKEGHIMLPWAQDRVVICPEVRVLLKDGGVGREQQRETARGCEAVEVY